MTVDRVYHAAEFTPGLTTYTGGTIAGGIVVMGGYSTTNATINSTAEIFGVPSQPAACTTGTFAATGGQMVAPRELFNAALIQNSSANSNKDLLVVGGTGSGAAILSSAELYVP